MSNATQSNFSLAMKARNDRIARQLGGEPMSSVITDQSPDWDAFWESLAGKNVNTAGLGQDVGPVQTAGSQNGAINAALGEDATRFKLSQAAIASANADASARQDANMRNLVDQDAVSRAFQPGLTRNQSLAAAGPMAPQVGQIFQQQDAAKQALSSQQTKDALETAQGQAALIKANAEADKAKAGAAGGPGSFGAINVPGLDTSKTGEDAIAGLPGAAKDMVRAIVQGRLTIPSGSAQREGVWPALLASANAYDPAMDVAATGEQTRQSVRKDFTSGASSDKIRSLNQALGHMDELNGLIDQIGGTGSSTANTVENYLTPSGSARGTALKRAELLKQGIGTEALKFFSGSSGGGEKELEAWKAQLDAADSPAAKKAALSQLADMMSQSANSYQDKYTKGMGAGAGPFQVVGPQQMAIMNRLRAGSPSSPSAAAAPRRIGKYSVVVH